MLMQRNEGDVDKDVDLDSVKRENDSAFRLEEEEEAPSTHGDDVYLNEEVLDQLITTNMIHIGEVMGFSVLQREGVGEVVQRGWQQCEWQ